MTISLEVVDIAKPEDVNVIPPVGVETETDVAARHMLLREIGYKL